MHPRASCKGEFLLRAGGVSGKVCSSSRPVVRWLTASALAALARTLSCLLPVEKACAISRLQCNDARLTPVGSQQYRETAPLTPERSADATVAAILSKDWYAASAQRMFEEIACLRQDATLIDQLGSTNCFSPLCNVPSSSGETAWSKL